MRALGLLLCLSISTALAAAPPKKKPAAPPADPTPATQDIDVDAMARAKDADANAAASSESPAPAAAATSTAAPIEAAASAPGTSAPAAPNAPSGEPAAAASPLTAPAVDPQEKRQAGGCEARATSLLDAAQKGDFKTAVKDFDAKMRGALPPEKFKDMWGSLAQFGTLQARGQSHPGKGEGYFIVMTPLIFDKANLVSQVACGSDGRIAGFNVKPLSAAQ
ncbi:MAG TPA: DUF3887 domain-containing protein [Dokdonella sp.]